jgi:hypothetical protein
MPARSVQGEIGLRRAARHVARWLVWAASLLAVLSSERVLRAEEGITRQTRIELIRGFVTEIVVTKVALPRSGLGLTVTPAGTVKGQTETTVSAGEIAIGPGLPAQITKVRFKSREIVFDLNGGRRSGKKWYDHIQISGVPGRAVEPVNTVTTYGTVIRLTFPNKLPNVTLAQVKQMMSVALDFERHSPTVLYSPNLPPKVKDAIKNHQVIVGMDRDAVLSSKGPPDRKIRETKEGVETEDWIYGLPPHVLLVTLNGDQVVAVRQY